MQKIILTAFALAAVCGRALAQYKQSGAMLPMNKHNTVLARKAIDTADLRILYAWGATDITQDSTYLDCGQLQIGKKMTKYCSLFVEQADDERVKWAKANPHPKGYPNGTWWMQGRKPDIWSEYQHSNIFIHGDTLNEWATMPAGQEWPQRYEEKWTGQEWTLQSDTATFLGLPGLIMKIHDVDSLYVFEAIAIEKGEFPIWQYPKEEFMKSNRTHTWKLQIAFNRNYRKTAGIRDFNPDGTVGDLQSSPHDYDPMELE